MTTTDTWRRILHEDDHLIDKITVDHIERWKESEMSGDEWRFSWLTTFWRRGVKIHEVNGYHWWTANAEKQAEALAAAKALAAAMFITSELADPYAAIQPCAQPGCVHGAAVSFRFKRIWWNHNESTEHRQGQEVTDYDGRAFTSFCARHRLRGDCGLNDADVNYEVIAELAETTIPVRPRAIGLRDERVFGPSTIRRYAPDDPSFDEVDVLITGDEHSEFAEVARVPLRLEPWHSAAVQRGGTLWLSTFGGLPAFSVEVRP
jgi:hypothetical protein